jgi:hypothetical protein
VIGGGNCDHELREVERFIRQAFVLPTEHEGDISLPGKFQEVIRGFSSVDDSSSGGAPSSGETRDANTILYRIRGRIEVLDSLDDFLSIMCDPDKAIGIVCNGIYEPEFFRTHVFHGADRRSDVYRILRLDENDNYSFK